MLNYIIPLFKYDKLNISLIECVPTILHQYSESIALIYNDIIS